jgi:starch synthase
VPEKKLKILIATPEVVPFAKTGGLADVTGSLPKALSNLGHQVKVILPKYKMVDETLFSLKGVDINFPEIPLGEKKEKIKLKSYKLSASAGMGGPVHSEVEYLFIINDKYYERDELYKDKATGFDYADNDERFILFARGTLEVLKALNWQPDVIHANDWQSALLPAYLKTHYAGDPFFAGTATVFTIHNLAYQGNFPKDTFPKIGVAKDLFYPTSPFEFWGNVNFLKVGISYADVLNTVSERYAVEIQSSSEFGYGLEGVLRTRNADLYGIVNGVDYEEWSPEKDKFIPHRYSMEDLSGKEKNKRVLLEKCNLPKTSGRKLGRNKNDVPLIGIISRLADQKGFDILAEISDQLLSLDLRMVLLGTGDEKYHKLFKQMAKKYPEKISVNLRFDDPLAHLIEAGSDMFLMPSRYEPCGLNQLYSLKYGTLPIVRETGGLADTIQDFNPDKDGGTGFVFKDYDSDELLEVVKKALRVYQDEEIWTKLMRNGMQKDFSWQASAKKYEALYQKALQKQSPIESS